MHRMHRPLGGWITAFVVLAAAVALPGHRAAAQVPVDLAPSDTLYEVQLVDGSTIFARVVAVSGDSLTLGAQGGARVQVTRAQIRRMRPVQGRLEGGELWTYDPHGTRLFFGPTARSLAAGEGYFGVFELFFPFLTFGLSDNVLFTAGTPIIPEAIGEFAYIGPKWRLVSAERTQIAIGALAGLYDGGTAGIAYAVGTWGSRDNALTAGAGWGFWVEDDESGTADDPLIMIGAEARAGRRTKLITENYFVLGESGAVVSGGVRFWGERLSADFGLAALVGDDELGCCLPMLNFVYSFGAQR